MPQPIADLDILTEADKAACETIQTTKEENTGKSRRLFIETYGCQMNFSDSEIVASVMRDSGFDTTDKAENADVIFLNTCSIRDNAEQRVHHRLNHLQALKKKKPGTVIGVLGCMAERLKKQLLEEKQLVDLVAGPDAYRDLPSLVAEADEGHQSINVFLSREETYADIAPVRLNSNGLSAFISIMRGCDNMCSFCVVPFTRGRERSRDAASVVAEAQDLFDRGYREVTLLGQNVDSYKWKKPDSSDDANETVNFAQLMAMVAEISPALRVRFTTSHPKDMTDEVLHTMKRYDNICNYIHLPVQSGNSRVLDIMNRTYDQEWYINRVEAIKRIIGEECGISTDVITGFCTETEEEHQDTLKVMQAVKYDYAYMFAYSERPGTLAAKKFADDIPEEVKKRRLQEVIALQSEHSLERNQQAIGKEHLVLVEGRSKRSEEHLCGRNSQNKMIIFPKEDYKKGDYVWVKVADCTSATLFGTAVKGHSIV